MSRVATGTGGQTKVVSAGAFSMLPIGTVAPTSSRVSPCIFAQVQTWDWWMSAQEPLVSLMESFFEQPKLPAITSVTMSALKPIDINLLLPKVLYTDSPPTLPKTMHGRNFARVSTGSWSPRTTTETRSEDRDARKSI